MKYRHLAFTAGMLIAMPCFALTTYNSQFDNPRVQRYYEENRQLYEQDQAQSYRVWHRYERQPRYRYQAREHRFFHRQSYSEPTKSTQRFQPHLMPEQIASYGEKVFIFSPQLLTWAAYDANGELVRKGHGSGGRGYCPDIGRGCHTPIGTFRVIGKRGPECKSSIYPKPYGGAKMPYCMFFSKNYAVHGSYDVPDYNASHGCVRVYPQDAQWLNSSFMSIGTKVIIKPY